MKLRAVALLSHILGLGVIMQVNSDLNLDQTLSLSLPYNNTPISFDELFAVGEPPHGGERLCRSHG